MSSHHPVVPGSLALVFSPTAHIVMMASRRVFDNPPAIIERAAISGQPWQSLADLLVDERTNTFVGITYALHPYYCAEEIARRIAGRLDTRSIRYVSAFHSGGHELDAPSDLPRFDVIWADSEPTTIELGQLVDDTWFSNAGESAFDAPPIAIGLDDVRAITRAYGLEWPRSFCVPAESIG